MKLGDICDRTAATDPRPEQRPDSRPESRPRVLVLSDIRLLRDSLVHALSRHPAIAAARAACPAAAGATAASLRPDALLLDAGGVDPAEAIAQVHAAMPDVRIVAFGIADDEPAIMACARAGVSGFATRDAGADDLVAAIHAAVRGELVCSPRAAGVLLSHISTDAVTPSPPEPATSCLTQREREIAALISEGASNKLIARRLSIQSATVKNHVHSILYKLGIQRRGEVVGRLLPRLSGMMSAAALSRGPSPQLTGARLR